MTMRWNDRISFERHGEQMREFRRSHVEVELINGPRLDEAASLIRLHLLRTQQMQAQTGGAAFYSDVSGNEYLTSMWKVAPYRLSMN